MIKLDVKITSPTNLDFVKIFDEEVRRAIQESLIVLQREVATNTPVGVTGTLRAGIARRMITNRKGEVAVRGPAQKYADIREVGRLPGKMPPHEPLELWVKRKLRPAKDKLKSATFLVRRKIGRAGYRGAFMFRDAENKKRNEVLRILRRGIHRFEKRVSG